MENKAENKTPEQEHADHERCDKVINKALKESTHKYFINYIYNN